MSIDIPQLYDFKLVSTIAYGYSEVDMKYRLKYFLQKFASNFLRTEAIGSVEVKAPELSALTPDVKNKIESYAEFDVKSQMIDHSIYTMKIHGTFGRSPGRQKYLVEQPEGQECIKAFEADENTFVACEKINVLADVYDQFNFSFMLERSELLKSIILPLNEKWETFLPEDNVEINQVTPRFNESSDRVDVSVRLTTENTLDIDIFSPGKNIKLKDLGINELAIIALPYDQFTAAIEYLTNYLENNNLDSSAVKDKSRKFINYLWYSVTLLTFYLFLPSCLYRRQITGENVQ